MVSRLCVAIVGLLVVTAVVYSEWRDIARQKQLDLVVEELAALRSDISARARGESFPPDRSSDRQCVLDSAMVEAIAIQVGTRLSGAGATPVGRREPVPAAREARWATPEQQEALARANALVESVLGRGRLTQEEVRELRSLCNPSTSGVLTAVRTRDVTRSRRHGWFAG
jgi:hypothetical protein